MNKLHSQYLTFRALQHKFLNKTSFQSLIEHEYETEGFDVPVKNLCAKVSESLVNEVDRVSSILNISKREFVELAVSILIEEFYEIAKTHDIFDQSLEIDFDSDAENQEELPL